MLKVRDFHSCNQNLNGLDIVQVNHGDNLQSDIISGFPICPWFRYESRKWTCLAIFLRILFFTCLWCSCSFVFCKLVLGTWYELLLSVQYKIGLSDHNVVFKLSHFCKS